MSEFNDTRRSLGVPNGREGVTIQLVGPGGAGKTTVGAALAMRLGVAFVDLDHQFIARFGDISAFLRRHGYKTYAAQNVRLYLDLARTSLGTQVMALSSGFMTYPAGVYSDCGELPHAIAASSYTAVLLPSFDLETCVAETVRRQVERPFGRGAAREEEVIRARFGLYRALVAPQFATMRGVDTIVEDLMMLFGSSVTPHRPLRG